MDNGIQNPADVDRSEGNPICPAGAEDAADILMIGYYPPSRYRDDAVLLSTLEALFPVRFESCEEAGLSRFRACILRVDSVGEGRRLSRLCSRSLVVPDAPSATATTSSAAIRFAHDPAIDYTLRGLQVEETDAQTHGVMLLGRGRVLAQRDGNPVWTRTEDGATVTDWTASPPPHLVPGEALAEHWGSHAFMHLLPWLHLLRELTVDRAFLPPPPRACFIFDDPNLTLSTYGHIDFRALADSVSRHHYHVAVATIPLDYWRTSQQVIDLFRQVPDGLSLLMHGNNHTRLELQCIRSEAANLALLAQALRRADRLAYRTGIAVARVMEAPHGLIAPSMFHPLAVLGYEAALLTPSQVTPLNPGQPWCTKLGLDAMTVLPEGLGDIPRIVMTPAWRTNVALAAFLRQPVVLAGHHQDVAGGLGLIEAFAKSVNSLVPTVQWTGPAGIARAQYQVRRTAGQARVRLGARRVDCELPAGLHEVIVERPWLADGREEYIVINGLAHGTAPLRLRAGAVSRPLTLNPDCATVLSIKAPPDHPVQWQQVHTARTGGWPVLRRLLTEGRDRTATWRVERMRGALPVPVREIGI